jgi:drug/metabolite transporter (DMT)-like permease
VQRNVAIGSLNATIAFCAVGSSFAAADHLTSYPVAGGQALRYGLAGVLLLGFLRGRLPRVGRGELFQLTLLAAVGLAAFNLLMVAAVTDADAASVGAIVGCVPVAVAIGGPLMGRRRIDPRLLGAACVVAAGVLLVQGAGGGMSVAAVLLSLGALLCEAAFTLLAAPLLPRLGAAVVATWAVLIATVLLACYALLVDGPAHALAAPTTAEALALVYMAAAVTAVAFVLCYSAVDRLGVERAGLFAGLVPVSALLAAAALGDSEFTVVRLLGASAVAVGLVVGLRLSNRQPLPAPAVSP